MSQPVIAYVDCSDTQGVHRMAYTVWGDPQAAHVVICVHGLTRQGRDFDVLAQALVAQADHPLRVICPDVVGRGLSDWLPQAQAYQLPQYVSDMATLMTQLHSQAPIQTLDWVGTSMGGLIGMVVAGQPELPKPCAIRRLVLNDVGPAVSWVSIQRMQTYVGQTGRFDNLQEAADAMWAISQGFGPHTPQAWLTLSAPMVKTQTDGSLTLHYDPAIGVAIRAMNEEAAQAAQTVLWQIYDQISASTLLLRGQQSDLLTVETAQAMTSRGPCATLVEWDGIGHAPTLTADYQVQAVAKFLLKS